MNLRQAVLCERLQRRAHDCGWPVVPEPEDHLDVLEAQLGFTFPEMFRILYRTMSFSLVSFPGIDEPMASFDEQAAWVQKYAGQQTPGKELPPSLIEALRRYPGSYFSWGEDGVSEHEPEWWVDLAGREPCVVLDGHSGYLYYEERGENWSQVSFCAPSIEDWLERELDATHGSISYFPLVKLTTILEVEPPQPEAEPSVFATMLLERTMALRAISSRTPIADTEQLREENLRDEELDPLERQINEWIQLLKASHGVEARLARLQKLGTPRAVRAEANLRSLQQLAEQDVTKLREKLAARFAHDKALQIQRRLWRISKLRHQVLRELYTLIEELDSREYSASSKGSTTTAGKQEVQLLIEADSALFRFLSLDRRPEDRLPDELVSD